VRVARPSLPPLSQYTAQLRSVWDSAMLSNDGTQARALERAFARYSQAGGFVLAASNCDVALTLLIASLELPRGAHAVLPSFSYPSLLHAVQWNGLRPRFVDVDPHDWCLHAEQLEDQLDDVALILATHMFGVPCDVGGLERVAGEHECRLVLDAAQAIATWVGERHVTDFGDGSAISFSATKLVTSAEGAVVVTNSPRVGQRMDLLRRSGMDRDGASAELGLNAKLSELHAALGVLSLGEIEQLVAQRAGLTQDYRSQLSGRADLALQRIPGGSRETPTYFVVELGRARDRVRAALAAQGIEARPYFPALHRMPRMADIPRTPLPVTDRLDAGLLALPLHAEVTAEIVRETCEIAIDQLERESTQVRVR
jgi:dTDP-4-amino-4,6-dideoxygalactose transaminase